MGIKILGQWILRGRKKLNTSRMRWAFTAALLSLVFFLLLDTFFPLPAPKPFSPEVRASDGSLLRCYLSKDDKWRMQVHLEDVPAELPKALIAKEDRWFYWHPGVNPLAIGRALFGNAASGARNSGASTITMQVARMMEPKPRTIWGKIQESFRAFQLEWHHSKTEILEMYMSYLPYGGNVEGVSAASHIYFDRPPSQLSLSQCVLLTVIPNRPNSLRPDANSPETRESRDKWLRRFSERGIFPAAQLTDALTETIPTERKEFAYHAPQFCEWVQRQAPESTTQTTLSPKIQLLTQNLLGNHVRRVQASGISNGAAIVVDNRTMNVLAYCGSADFHNKAASGEVDGIHAVRSPGSTLKPFIYAMAFDQGILTPKMKLLDVPKEFSDFSPVNYDRQFRGEVSAEEALRHSLNLPAVRLLNDIGIHNFIWALREAGFASVSKHHKDLGLSLALGGCGATMEELVRAYAALANGGVLRPLRFLESEPQTNNGHRICSAEAAYMVTEILSGIQRPDLPPLFLSRSKLPKVAWKTGTSFGRRDAWSVGYNPRYTIGVWMGNMDGSPVLEMSGSKTAVPLMLDLFNAIDYDADKHWFSKPERLRERVVCAESGLPPAHTCTQLTKDLTIQGVTTSATCQRDREIFTNPEGTLQYCTACLPASGYQKRRFSNLNPELTLWMVRSSLDFQRPPAHNPECEGVFHVGGPEIHSPAQGETYFVEAGQELLLQAAPDPESEMHYWFADGAFLGGCAAGERFFFAPQNGKIEVTCMDDKGRKRNVSIAIERI
ncbi:MAG: penicillin-binding protein 1C [Bacteroidetes bacterium]|nr:penicillin-binding protein 1C [Bacteroidota bacterium]